MIELTVMTMDSKSRKFKVSDMLTILEFKEHIADQVKIKAVDQRLIFLGRVLDNQTKLADIAVDIDGKVFHLVHKVPRLATTTTGSTSSTSTNTISRSRRPLRENLWRVTHLDDNIRLPTGRLNSGNLLNSMIHDTEDKLKIAMNMIQRSNEILNGLEHARITKDLKQIPEELQQTEDRSGNVPKSSRQPVQSDSYSETVSDEVDETFPNNVASGASRPILFSAFLCDYAMRHRSRLNIGESSRNSTEQFSDTNVPTLSTNPSLTEQATGLLPPSAATEQNSRNDCLNSETRSSALSNNRHNLKKLIDQLNRLNIRLEPFLAQYCQYINEDPQFESIEGGNGSNRAQAIFNGVSEVMHFISHVYHAISDFNFFLNRPPPRFLQLNSSDSIPHNYLTNYTSAILPPSSTQRHVSTQTTSTNQSTYVPGVDSPNLREESPNVPNVSTSTEKNSDISDDSNIELNDTIDIPLHIEIMNEPVGFGSNETFVNPIETSQDTAVPQPSSGNETSNFDANLDNCVERTHSIGLEPIPFPDDSNSVPPTSTCTHCETSETTNSSSTTNLPPQAEKCKSEWTKLRNCFLNSIKRRKGKTSGQSAKSITPWKYAQQMEFLLPYLQNLELHSNIETQSLKRKSNAVSNNCSNNLTEESQSDALADPDMEINHNLIREKEFSIKKKKSDYAVDMVQIMRENSSMREESYEKKLSAGHDDTELFYLSMAKIAKQLPRSKEAKLRMEVCNKVSEAELAYLAEVDTLKQQNVVPN